MRDLNNIKFVYNNEELCFKISCYLRDGAVAIIIEAVYVYETYATLTVNIPCTILEKDEILVKTWSENEPITDFLRNSEFFEDTGKRVPTGFVEAEIWRIK